MPDDPDFTHLINKRYVTLILRLLVDRQGKFQLGSLVDLNEETVARFRQLNELPGFIARWLETRVREQNSTDPDGSL